MRKTTLIAIACTGLLAVPATAGAQNGASKQERQAAKQACQQERKAVGQAAFKQLHGRQAMRNCRGKAVNRVQRQTANAAKQCKAERDEVGGDAFREQYGTNASGKQGAGRNAFGKCVSSKVRSANQERAQGMRNAARTCRSERQELGAEEFRSEYGTGPRQRNAFGRCVRQTVKEQRAENGNGEENGSENGEGTES